MKHNFLIFKNNKGFTVFIALIATLIVGSIIIFTYFYLSNYKNNVAVKQEIPKMIGNKNPVSVIDNPGFYEIKSIQQDYAYSFKIDKVYVFDLSTIAPEGYLAKAEDKTKTLLEAKYEFTQSDNLFKIIYTPKALKPKLRYPWDNFAEGMYKISIESFNEKFNLEKKFAENLGDKNYQELNLGGFKAYQLNAHPAYGVHTYVVVDDNHYLKISSGSGVFISDKTSHQDYAKFYNDILNSIVKLK